MKKKTAIMLALAALAVIVAAGAGIGRAYAYFTTYVQASGKRPIELGDSSTITEEYEDGSWKKEISITNDASSVDAVYVRAKAFAGSEYVLEYESEEGEWLEETSESGETWYVYQGVVVPGDSAPVLTVYILGKDGEKPVLEEGKTINVVVVYETTPAVENGTDEDGNVQYEPADWSRGTTASEEAPAEEVPEEGGEN